MISSNFSILCKLYRLQLGKFHSFFSQRNKYQNSHATYQLAMLKVHLSKPMEDDSCLLQKRRVMFATLAHLSTPYSFPTTKVEPQKKLLYLLVRVFDIDKSTSFTEKKCLYQSTSPLLLLILKNLDRISNSVFYTLG